ncbi:hypothetical protein Taro_044247 [Colocasia esculenta]|uniref:Uncharacterized protein n=1 Tax=Colocasia esculenta TaxID=4460 RepID=A0A843X0F2_COLES|nr:hypothetical protein [Colocasia esculenta]
MWTSSLGGLIGNTHVDANLYDLQNIVVFRSRQTLFYKLLVLFTAFVPVVLVCSVLGEFPTEPVTSEAHPYPHRSLKWLIEEIGVVEEMIHRKVLIV